MNINSVSLTPNGNLIWRTDEGSFSCECLGGAYARAIKEFIEDKFSALTEKVVRLEGELAISKGREEGKQLVINQLEGENIAALTRLGVQAIQYQLEINKLKAECERLRQDAKAMVDVVRGNQLTKEPKPWTR